MSKASRHRVSARGVSARGRGVVAVVMAVAARPQLWATAVRQVLVMARPGWWRQWPPLPLPDGRYLELRLQTAYGDAAAPLVATDVVGYLGWCRAWPKVTGRRH